MVVVPPQKTSHLVLEEQKVSREPRDTAVAEMNSKVRNPIVVDTGQVTQSILDAVQEFAWFSTISAVDSCDTLLARASRLPVPTRTPPKLTLED